MIGDTEPVAPVCCGEGTQLTCAVCCEPLPTSGVMQAEAHDYVYYFCGPGCFNEWRDKAANTERDGS